MTSDVTQQSHDVNFWLQNQLACPKCQAPIALPEVNGAEIRCEHCGVVGKRRLGCADFLSEDSELIGALDAHFDLQHDADVAAQVWERREQMEHRELSDFAVGLLRGEDPNPPRGGSMQARARVRYEQWYHCVACEVGNRAGEGTVQRANASRISRSLSPLSSGLAVEAGSGVGRHLPGLAQNFANVICVDCSLTYIVLAQELARRAGATNVAFVRANVERLPLRSDCADLVHQNGVIEHVADPEAIVRESLRVTAPGGSYVCVSPNRYPITPEAHFKLPLFGLFPAPVRARLIPLIRGVDSEVGTDLRSLAQLRRYFAAQGVSAPHAFFVSPGTHSTVRSTLSRRLIIAALRLPGMGRLSNLILNRWLLGIAPYQVLVAEGSSASRPAQRA